MADGKVVFETELDTSGLQRDINNLERTGLTTLDFGMSMDGITKLGTHLGKVMGAQIALAIVKSTAKAGIAFDTAMSQVAATMGTTVDSIRPLEELARKTGESGLYTATEAAEALNYLALAGWDTEQILGGFAEMVTLAAAGAMDLATSSDIVTDVITAMGLEVSDTARLADELAVANNKANGTVKQYGQAMLELGATGQIAAGGTTEQLTSYGLLANNGIKGAKAGRQLRNVITSLAAPTDQAAEQLQTLGVSAYDSEGNFRPLIDTFSDLSASMATFTEEKRTQAIREIFNKEDLKSVNALLQTSSAEWVALYGEIANSQGAASKMAQTQLDNLGGDVKKFNAAIDGLKLETYNTYEPIARAATQAGTVAVQAVTAPIKEYNALMGTYRDMANEAAEAVNNPDIQELLKAPVDWFAPLDAAPITLLQDGEKKSFWDSLVDFFIPSAGAAELPPELRDAGEQAAAGWADSIVQGIEKEKAGIQTAASSAITLDETAENPMVQHIIDQIAAVQLAGDTLGESEWIPTVDVEDKATNKINAISKLLDKLNGKSIKVYIDAIKSGFGVDGEHRTGLDFVPFDGYIAELHRGERVLTASEASAYRENISAAATPNIGGDIFNKTADLSAALRQAMKGLDFNQTVNFNVPVQTPDEFAQTMFLYNTYGLTEA